MLFNSYVFLFYFLPISIVCYYGLAHLWGVFPAKLWLVACSFVFYGWWNPVFVLLLLLSIAVNYSLSLAVLGTEENPVAQRWLLTLGVTLNLAALFYYKYLFPLLGFVKYVGWSHIDFGEIVLPLGISFFTFTQIGFLVDCQQGLVRERNLLDYVLFVTFFPHLIAGPILHHREIMPQFANAATYRFDDRNIAIGITVFILGLLKKAVLADSIAPWAEAGFQHPASLGLLSSWSTILAYSMQLYFDFSGYSDMAIGLGIMFGVRLPLNFNSPYKSTSVIDFWQRWHMTLTRYLTLLIYNPISLHITRRRVAKGLPTNRQATSTVEGFVALVAWPTIVTMFLAGIWHGAGMQFIVFGMLHAVYLTVNHAWRIFGPRAPKSRPAWQSMLDGLWRVALTYLCVLLAQIFFRAVSVHDALALLGGAFGAHGTDLPLVMRGGRMIQLGPIGAFLFDHGIIAPGLPELFISETRPLVYNSLMVAGMMLIVWFTPNVYQILGDASPALQKVPPTRWRHVLWRPNLVWAGTVGVMFFYALTKLEHPGRFLYFQF